MSGLLGRLATAKVGGLESLADTVVAAALATLAEHHALLESDFAPVLGDVAAQAARNAESAEIGGKLVESLQARSNQIRGVDLDEEMANLILFEQSYAASARVIGTLRSMFESLDAFVA